MTEPRFSFWGDFKAAGAACRRTPCGFLRGRGRAVFLVEVILGPRVPRVAVLYAAFYAEEVTR